MLSHEPLEVGLQKVTKSLRGGVWSTVASRHSPHCPTINPDFGQNRLTAILTIVSLGCVKHQEHPRTALRLWRESVGSYSEAGRRLECDPTYVAALEKPVSGRYPGRRLANLIERVVGTPSTAWDDLEAAEKSEADAAESATA